MLKAIKKYRILITMYIESSRTTSKFTKFTVPAHDAYVLDCWALRPGVSNRNPASLVDKPKPSLKHRLWTYW